jgi:hypothetical protein
MGPNPRPPACKADSLNPADREVVEKKREQPVEGHKRLLAHLAERLGDLGWGKCEEYDGATDLFSTNPDGLTVLFEAKTVTPENAHKQVRAAIIQLLEYRHFLHNRDDVACVVTNGRLPERSRELLRELSINAIWWDGTNFVAPTTPSDPSLRQVAAS